MPKVVVEFSNKGSETERKIYETVKRAVSEIPEVLEVKVKR